MHVYADRQIDSHTSKDPCTHACCHVYTHAPAQWHTIHRQSHGLSDVLIKGLLSFFPLECSQWKQPRLADKDSKLYEPVPEPRLVVTWLRCRDSTLPTESACSSRFWGEGPRMTCRPEAGSWPRGERWWPSSVHAALGAYCRAHHWSPQRRRSPAKGRRLPRGLRRRGGLARGVPHREHLLWSELHPHRGERLVHVSRLFAWIPFFRATGCLKLCKLSLRPSDLHHEDHLKHVGRKPTLIPHLCATSSTHCWCLH